MDPKDLTKTKAQAAASTTASRPLGGVDAAAQTTAGFFGLDQKAIRAKTRAAYTVAGGGVPLATELLNSRLFVDG